MSFDCVTLKFMHFQKSSGFFELDNSSLISSNLVDDKARFDIRRSLTLLRRETVVIYRQFMSNKSFNLPTNTELFTSCTDSANRLKMSHLTHDLPGIQRSIMNPPTETGGSSPSRKKEPSVSGTWSLSMSGWWFCCRCDNLQNSDLSPDRCPSCGHSRCQTCPRA